MFRIALATFSRTSLDASFKSRSSTNRTVICPRPSAIRAWISSIPDTPLIASSIGSTTEDDISSGLAPGSEPYWPHRDPANPFPIPLSHYKWLVFADPDWDWRTFEWTDPADSKAFLDAESKYAPILNATNPDLREFRKRGGKLIQWHGWNDQLISAQNSIDYYESVLAFERRGGTAPADVHGFYRLFMVPGMAHCSGGTGPNSFDMQAALEQWVERGVAPGTLVARNTRAGFERPACQWPATPRYTGGDAKLASSFRCE